MAWPEARDLLDADRLLKAVQLLLSVPRQRSGYRTRYAPDELKAWARDGENG